MATRQQMEQSAGCQVVLLMEFATESHVWAGIALPCSPLTEVGVSGASGVHAAAAVVQE